MSTLATDEMTETKPGRKAGFEFQPGNGECLNPEKVIVQVGELGAACALLVARNAEGRWWAGFQCGGRNLAYTTLTPGAAGAGGTRIGYGTREEAVEHAGEMVLEWIEGIREPAAEAIRKALAKHFGYTYAPGEKAGCAANTTAAAESKPVAANADDWQPAPNKTGFQFDADDVCTNPERVEIPCPAGYQCALFVAQQADGGWTFGAIRAGGNEELFKYEPRLVANGEETREDALETALVVALENGEPESAINRALEEWRAEQSRKFAAEVDAEIKAVRPKTPPKGKERLEIVRQLVEAGETAVGVACKAGLRMPDAARALAKLGFDGPGPWSATDQPKAGEGVEEKTPAMESLPPPAVLPGMEHQVNENGVFTTSESVVIGMPKKATCTLRLACSAADRWAVGWEIQLPGAGNMNPPKLENATHETRAAALDAGLVAARDFFAAPGNLSAADIKLANRCGEAVVRYRDDFRAKLIESAAAEPVAPRVAPVYHTEFAELPVAKIQENPQNHRKHFNAIKDRELADSLLSEGLHQPIAVRKLLDGEQPEGELPLGDPSAPEYELIFGHRRRRAAVLAGLATLQAKIYFGLTRKQATAIALIENLQREDINAMEEAEAYAQLMADENLTQELCADRVGRARSTVANALGLLRLPESLRESIRDGVLTSEHGKALLRFVPTLKERERWAAEFPAWEKIVKMMAELAIERKLPSSALEKGIPFAYELTHAGVAVRIDQFGEHRVNGKHREHAAYFAIGDGDWVCFAPEHWHAEVADRVKRAEEKEEADKKRRAEEMEKLTKGSRKQLKLGDLNPDDYREFTGANEALLALVPDDKKAAAKGYAGRTMVVTDVQLAERLQRGMLRAIKENRKEAIVSIEEKVRKKIAKLKKVGPREMAWLVYLFADSADRSVYLRLSTAAAKAAGVKLPPAVLVSEIGGIHLGAANIDGPKRLAALAKCDGAELVRVLIAERLPMALEEIVASGPESVGARFVKWWLETDTLWLLEETEEGRAELVEMVKQAPWFAKLMAGGTEDES
jgi:ParB family chromosome partitioning protein